MGKKKVVQKESLHEFLYISLAVLVLLLSMFNLQTQKRETTVVLGATVDNTYWEEIVAKHPTYVDAWVELDRMDKVKQIDPNFTQL